MRNLLSLGEIVKKIKLKLHFGVQRTGSSTIKKRLVASDQNLKVNGFLHPELGVQHRHTGLAWKLNQKNISIKEIMDRITKEITPNIHTVIIAGEDFALVEDFQWLSVLQEYYDVEVAMYLKRQDLWLESWYNQHVKWPWSKKFSGKSADYFYENIGDFSWIAYDELLSKITTYLPPHKQHIQVLDGAGIKDSATDFFAFCDIPAKLIKTVSEQNASISMAQIEVLRRVDLANAKGPARIKIIKALQALKIDEDDGKKAVFTDFQVTNILKRFEQSNMRVAKEYFDRDVLFTDPVILNRHPVRISDEKAYSVYLPQLIKKLAEPR